MNQEFMQVIKDRVSVRDYSSKKVNNDLIDQVLEAGHLAASAGNLQPWSFYIVKNKAKIKEIAGLAKQEWVSRAPVAIVVCADPQISAAKYGERGANLYVIQDTAAAVENILLAATAYDLGSCWVGSFSEEELKSAVDIKEEVIPMAVVTLGYPAGPAKEARPQRALTDIVTRIN